MRVALLLLLSLTAAFTLAATLQPRALQWSKRLRSDSALSLIFGDSRRLFARHFYVKADVAFHSGFYPSIFDQARHNEEEENAIAHAGSHEEKEESGHEKESHDEPTDWIARFGRHFRVTEHTHLQDGKERELLPWLRASAELDPQRIETYTVAAYWLRQRLKKAEEAEQFLREGLRANPDSYEILFELGCIFVEDRHDSQRARNLWELALRKWQQQQADAKEPDMPALLKIAERLARLEEEQGNLEQAIAYFEKAKTASPNPSRVAAEIEELKQKLAVPSRH